MQKGLQCFLRLHVRRLLTSENVIMQVRSLSYRYMIGKRVKGRFKRVSNLLHLYYYNKIA